MNSSRRRGQDAEQYPTGLAKWMSHVVDDKESREGLLQILVNRAYNPLWDEREWHQIAMKVAIE